ncbi:MAG: hypothetical protein ABI705_02035 [Aestuariivirga sp.]
MSHNHSPSSSEHSGRLWRIAKAARNPDGIPLAVYGIMIIDLDQTALWEVQIASA